MGSGVHVSLLGHATVRVEVDGRVALTDPLLRPRIAFLRWTAPRPDPQTLDATTVTVISHLHHDHCDPASLARLGRDRPLVVPWGSEGFFRRRGFTSVVALRPGERHEVDGVEVTATPAAHDGSRRPFGPAAVAVGYLIAVGGRRVYFAGDTDLFADMAAIGSVAPLDVALVPVWGWGPSIGPGHLDPDRAARATELLRPKVVVPIHWDGLRPAWERRRTPEAAARPVDRFVQEVRRLELPTEVRVLSPGASMTWP